MLRIGQCRRALGALGNALRVKHFKTCETNEQEKTQREGSKASTLRERSIEADNRKYTRKCARALLTRLLLFKPHRQIRMLHNTPRDAQAEARFQRGNPSSRRLQANHLLG